MRFAIPLFLSALLVGCGSYVEDVEIYATESNWGQAILEITAIADETEIKDVVVNRGNCKINTSDLPKKLVFGQTYKMTTNVCNLKELDIETKAGHFTYQFD